MPYTLVSTQNDDRNLAANPTVWTGTVSVSTAVFRMLVVLGDGNKNLSGIGGDYLFTLTIDGVQVRGGAEEFALGTASRAVYETSDFIAPGGSTVSLKVASPNASETDVDVTASCFVEDGATGTQALAIKAKTDLIGTGDAFIASRVDGSHITLFNAEEQSITVNAGVDLTGLTLELVFEDKTGADIAVVQSAGLTIASNAFSFVVPAALTSAERSCSWSLRVVSTKETKAFGTAEVTYQPVKD